MYHGLAPSGGWSEDGCILSGIDNSTSTVLCHCYHLTSFAVLLVSAIYNVHVHVGSEVKNWLCAVVHITLYDTIRRVGLEKQFFQSNKENKRCRHGQTTTNAKIDFE